MSRSQRRETPSEDVLDGDRPVQGEAEAAVALHELEAAVEAALARMPDHHARLMRMLLDPAEPSYDTIAATLGVPIGSIGPTRSHCLERLRADRAVRALAEAVE